MFSGPAVIIKKDTYGDKYTVVGTNLSITELKTDNLGGSNARALGFAAFEVPVEGSGVLSVSNQSFTQEYQGVKVEGVWIEDASFNWKGDINVNLSGFSKKQITGMNMKQVKGKTAISSEIIGNVVVNIDSKDGNLEGETNPPEIIGMEFHSEEFEPTATYTFKGDVSSTVRAVSPKFEDLHNYGNNFFAALSLEQESSGLLTVNLGEAGSTINLSTSVEGTGAKDEYVFGAEVIGRLNITGSNVTISSENTGKGMSWALGVGGEGAKININAGNLVIQSKTNGGGQAIGIASFTMGEVGDDEGYWVPSPEKPDSIDITATQTTITASAPNSTAESDAIGIRSPHHTTININGNLNINASISGGQKGVAIQANDGSKININPEGNSLVNIFGDIQYNSNSDGDDETIEKSSIALNLGSNGTWEGNFYLVGNENNSSMTLNLKQGATWTPTNPEGLPYFSGVSKVAAYASIASLDEENNFLLPVKLTLDGGTVDASTLTGKNTQVQVASLSGSGGTFVTNVSKENGKYEATNSLVIGTVDETAGKPNLTTTTNSVQSGELSSEEAEQVLNALASTVAAPEGQLDKAVLVTDQAGGPDVFAKVPENGQITADDIVYRNNSVFDALETAVALGTSQWRAQIGSLFKRLGEVRDDEGNIGAWVRVYQNRVKWNGEHNDTFTVQIGADYKFNDQFIAGGAFNYSDGNTKLNGVKDDNHAWGFAMYGTWLGPDGIYVDLEGKYNRLDNKITSRGNTAYMHGKYKGNAWSLSAQSGWTLPLSEMFFVEPQAQLSWGQAGSDTFSTGTYNVKQKAFNVVEGRLGAKAGVKFPEKRGQAYAKASVVYDWASKFKGSLATNGVESKFNEDLGGCAGEFAVGGQFNMTKNAHVYADVTTRVGGKLKEPFQWTVGLRYSF